MEPHRLSRTRLISVAVVLGLGLALLALFYFRDSIENLARARANRAAEQARLQSEEAAALRCIAELAKRDPAADAKKDFARGDQTPIGITYHPHDPPEPSTHFPGACELEYEGEYRPTGTWFPYSRDGYSLLGRPPSYGLCRRAAHDYAERYNRQAAILAPQSIGHFCRRQKLSASNRLGVAAVAVLGDARPVRETINGSAYWTKATWVVDTPFGPALVTKSYAAEADVDCGTCEVGVGIAYLTEDGAVIAPRRRWPLVWTRGSDRNRQSMFVGGLSLNDQLTSYPILGVNRRRLPNRMRCWFETSIELRPEGPVNRGTIYTHGSGRFENVERDVAFDVTFPGTRTPQRYEMKGGRFVGPNEMPANC